jgi:3-dehydroquinate synthetase
MPPVTDLRSAEVLEAVLHDKKVVDGKLHFVLARGLGGTEIVSDLHSRELKAALKGLGLRA